MINKLYGMLAPGALATEFYYRKSTQPEAYYVERDVLIPRTQELAYIQFCADQLCRLVSRNVLAGVLAELDPNNTYAHAAEVVGDESTEITGIPDGVVLNLLELTAEYPWVRKQIRLSFDGVATVTYDNTRTVTWGATGTTAMTSGRVSLSLNGPPAASSFWAAVTLVRRPSRDLMQLLTDLDALEGITWVSRLEPYKDSTVPATRLAAYVLNALAKI